MSDKEKLDLALEAIEDLIFLAEAEHMCLKSWNGVGSAANYDGIMERAKEARQVLRGKDK